VSEKMIRVLWRGKLQIAGLAVVAGLIGFVAASVWPKRYEASVMVRSAEAASFVPFSVVLADMPGEWHQTSNITGTVQQLFLQLVRDKVGLESFILGHRSLFAPDLDLQDRKILLEVMDDLEISTQRSALPYLMKRDNTEIPSLRFDFSYADGSQGVEFLNRYVDDLISQTNSRLLANARSTLESMKESRERELLKLREVRDSRARQNVLEYEEALATAAAANIQHPVVASLGSTAALVSANSPLPLYFYGTGILTSELRKFHERIGNDLAIPEFPAISASLKDIDNRTAAVEKLVVQPLVVIERAADPTRPKSPRPGRIAAIAALLGALAGSLLLLGRSSRLRAGGDAGLPT
jgi:LPS O-antigen subunit length determinant protein (WzzB/FepE family)